MPPLSGALPGPYVPVQVTSESLVSHRYTRFRTSQFRRTLIPFSASLWNDVGDPVFNGVGLVGFRRRANAFLLTSIIAPCLSLTVFPFSCFILWVAMGGLECSD